MDLKNKEDFKKYILSPLLNKIKEEFLYKKIDFEKFYRFEIEIKNPQDVPDPLYWLSCQNEQIKIYWSNRDKSFCCSGIGVADMFADGPVNDGSNNYFIKNIFDLIKLRISNTDDNIRYYGCIAFDENDKVDSSWNSFGKIYFFVPKVELYKIKGKTFLACNIFYNSDDSKSKKEIYEELQIFFENIQPFVKSKQIRNIKFINRKDNPEKDLWERNIKQVISIFDFEKIKKIVLSRKSVFELQENIDPVLLLALLKKLNIETYDFCFQNKNNNGFTGCTPELLYSRTDNKIFSEAVAGTILKGKNPEEEKKLGQNLLKSKKDSNEYKFVFDSIKNDLRKICTEVKILKEKEILKLSYAQHIYSQFEGSLKPDIDDYEIISVIHPTPAVSGYPKKNIKSLIKRYETYFRGFYAGPVGWIGKNSSEFVVGIRSALINKRIISIFSGAGIVKKSSYDAEWNEIENKISPFLKILKK